MAGGVSEPIITCAENQGIASKTLREIEGLEMKELGDRVPQ
jgi:hypothetical protein